MTTIGSVEDYDELRGLSPPGRYDVVLVRNQNASASCIPLSSPANDAIFVWDKEAGESDDGGTIISPDPTSPLKGRWKRVFDDSLSVLSVKWFGAKGDMKVYYPAAGGTAKQHYRCTVTLDELVLTPPAFTKADKDKIIVIWKDGAIGSPFVTTIKEYDESTKKVKLGTPAPPAISGGYVAWGTDDTDAIQKAIDVAKETGFTVYLPPGHYLITKTLSYTTFKVDHELQEDTYQLMRHGLQMFGAGPQVSFIHNQIKDGGATIIIDGAEKSVKGYSFQQTGFLKDFHITSTGQIPKTTGIDMRATWAYTIQNVHVMKMGSDAIIIHNNDAIDGSSDGDACHALHLDNVFAYKNEGWGIIVKAGIASTSTGKIYLERCWIELNQNGGIQWTGQIGVIERCGIYGNGCYQKGTRNPDEPTPVPDAYGILIKNVKGTSDSLLVTGCEIQDNAAVQVMVEVGANIKIIQNEFKVDDLDPRMTFPRIDIQVGDGNLDGRTVNACVIEDNSIRAIWNTRKLVPVLGADGKPVFEPDGTTPKMQRRGWGIEGTEMPPHTVVKVNRNAVGTIIGRWWTSKYQMGGRHQLVELVETDFSFREGHTHVKTHLHRDGTDGGYVLLPFASKRFDLNDKNPPDMKVYKRLIEEKVISVNESRHEVTFIPDTSNWSSFYLVIGGTFESLMLANPTLHSVGTPLFFELFNVKSDPITVTFGTKVGRKYESEYNAGERITLPPAEVVTGIMLFDERRQWTLHSPWTSRGLSLSERDRNGRKVIMTDEEKTLSPSEYNKKIIDVSADPCLYCSGNLTKPASVIFPLEDGLDWLVRNDTGQNLTLKGKSGSGVIIKPGSITMVFCDGKNLYT